MFVTSAEYEEVVISIASEEGELLVAVAFWGRGAESIVYPRPSGPVKLICNLKSGATNPATIEALNNKKDIVLKQHDRLHAKVVVGNKSAVVGSANFSSNGLNLEGEESAGWEEAGFVVKDLTQIGAIREWFQTMWDNAYEIDAQDIEDAKAKWKERRASRILKDSNCSCSFSIDGFTRAELTDRRIFVVIYKTCASEEAISAYHEEKKKLTGQDADHNEIAPIYEGWQELPEDAQLIDICYGPRGGLKCYGVYTRTHDLKFKYKEDDSEGHVAVCRKESQIIGRRFGRQESEQFVRKLRPCIDAIWNSESAHGGEDGKYIPLVDVVDICGRQGAPPDGNPTALHLRM